MVEDDVKTVIFAYGPIRPVTPCHRWKNLFCEMYVVAIRLSFSASITVVALKLVFANSVFSLVLQLFKTLHITLIN